MTQGPHSSPTVIPPLPRPEQRPEYGLPGEGQLQLWLRSYAPFKKFAGGYNGDARGPSTDTKDTSRLAYVFTFDFFKMSRVAAKAFCSRSHANGFFPSLMSYTSLKAKLEMNGEIEGDGTAREQTFVEPLGRPGSGMALAAQVSAANPLIGPAADIDLQMNVRLMKTWSNDLSLTGNVVGDAFPNCEVFLRDAAGDTILLFAFRTRGGQTTGPFTHLPGANFRIMGTISKLVRMHPAGIIN